MRVGTALPGASAGALRGLIEPGPAVGAASAAGDDVTALPQTDGFAGVLGRFASSERASEAPAPREAIAVVDDGRHEAAEPTEGKDEPAAETSGQYAMALPEAVMAAICPILPPPPVAAPVAAAKPSADGDGEPVGTAAAAPGVAAARPDMATGARGLPSFLASIRPAGTIAAGGARATELAAADRASASALGRLPGRATVADRPPIASQPRPFSTARLPAFLSRSQPADGGSLPIDRVARTPRSPGSPGPSPAAQPATPGPGGIVAGAEKMAGAHPDPATPSSIGEAALPRGGAFASPVGSEGWQQELSAQLAFMTEQGDDASAVMKLAPAELGELEIRLTLREGEAAVAFAASAAEARQALELAQPRLQELFASQGIGLGKVSISSGFSGNPQPEPQRQGSPRGTDRRTPPEAVESLTVRVRRAELGSVDTYA